MTRTILLILLVVTMLFGCCSSDDTKAFKEDSTAATTIKSYLAENFKGTTWYGVIKDVKVKNKIVTVQTDLYPDEEGKMIAATIAGAVLFCDDTEFHTVYVEGSNGRTLVRKP